MIDRLSTSWLFVALLAFALAACQGIVRPETLDQRLAYAYGVHTAVLNAAADGVDAGRISVEDGQAVMDLAEESRMLLDTTRTALIVQDLESAEASLELAIGVLEQVQAYLDRRTSQ